MKKLTLPLLASLALAAPAFAGDEISGKDAKQVLTEPIPVFKDHELQFSSFAEYKVGNGPTHVGLFRDHSWGDGGEVSYFFTRYIGIGAEYDTGYTKEGPDTDLGLDRGHRIDTYGVGGHLIFRFPIESCRLAPYVYVGGGAQFADRKYAEAHVGAGLEYRIVPSKFGLFIDARWTYMGDRYFPDDNATRGDLNYFGVRAGFKTIF